MAHKALQGVNLDGWLMLESWVTPELFAKTSTLDPIALANKLGSEAYAKLMHDHEESFITEFDFKQMAARGYNAVRLPVPWYVFGKDGPLPGFHTGSIAYVDKAFEWAEQSGIKILINIVLAPGADKTGNALRMKTDFTPARRKALLEIVGMLAARYVGRSSFLGIEPLDEVVTMCRRGLNVEPGMPLSHLRNLYRDAYAEIRRCAGNGPAIVFSDAGRHGNWKHFMASSRYENVWLDTHLYRPTSLPLSTAGANAQQLLSASREALAQARTSGLPVMVGEWSAALSVPGKTTTLEGRIAQERLFVAQQMSLLSVCPAWFFQTWKTSNRLPGWDARVALSNFERDMLR